MIDCTGLDKAEVLAGLYNRSSPLGMGIYQARSGIMTKKEAEKLLEERDDFDYLYGRPVKTDFSNYPILRENMYDRDQGEGAMQRVIDSLKK